MFGIIKSSFNKIKKALFKTRRILGGKIKTLFLGPVNDETLEELERILYEADIGSKLAITFTEKVDTFLRKNQNAKTEEILSLLKEEAIALLQDKTDQLDHKNYHPLVILMIGVNGSGKTTTVAKLAKKYSEEKKKVLVAAGDTFRAAATEQLQIWADRLGVDIVKGKQSSDPSAVIFDALSAGKARGADVIILDTAGRLQSKTDLMHELKKIYNVCKKVIPDSPHQTYLTLDATSGQNALDQAEIFHSFCPLTGLILTKLDSSSKGGIVLPIYDKLQIPITYIGVGEKEDDLIPFDKKEYVDSLFAI